ncbi:MAG: alpha amylase C-terminal domain-containing protein [Lachnospiraceae bacterium]|nr:alpha amylase C-terminal domain-containing protein [Lachnospiraceae bacterium]
MLEQYPMHDSFKRFMRDINFVYASHPALYEGEYNRECFSYVVRDRQWDLVYAFTRSAGNERLLAVFNFSDQGYVNYMIKAPGCGQLIEIINTDWDIYGGTQHNDKMCISVRNGQCIMDLNAYSGRLFVMC